MGTKGARLIFSYLVVIQSGESRERKGETVQLNMVAHTQHTALNSKLFQSKSNGARKCGVANGAFHKLYYFCLSLL